MTVTTGGPWGSKRPVSTAESVVEATHLQEELPPRDLGDVQKTSRTRA